MQCKHSDLMDKNRIEAYETKSLIELVLQKSDKIRNEIIGELEEGEKNS